MNRNTLNGWKSFVLMICLTACEVEEGAIGPDGLISLIKTTQEPVGENCSEGGIRIDTGIDGNSNDQLDDDEISSTNYICNGTSGQDGISSLASVSSEPPGDNCQEGGIRVDSGLDSNVNNVLDVDEITNSTFICHGSSPQSSLMIIENESAGSNCSNGGIRIHTGIDDNENDVLDSEEIDVTRFICNGRDGNNNLLIIENEPAGTNCENGGIKISTGIDENHNGQLDTDEIDITRFICDGLNAINSLMIVETEPVGGNCSVGGVKIDSGVDDNSDGILNVEEIDITRFICNGTDGSIDEEIRIMFPGGYNEFSSSTVAGDVHESNAIFDFNLENYPNVTSITLQAQLVTSSVEAECNVSAYNMTNGSLIEGSAIKSFSSTYESLETANFIEQLPSGKFNIGIVVSSSQEGTPVSYF